MLKIDDESVNDTIAAIVAAIQEARLKKGLSRYQLAKLTGLHPSTIGLIERGRRNPSLFVILKLADSLEIDIAELLNRIKK